MSPVDLLIFIVVIAFLTWLLLLLPPVKPFANIVYAIAVIIIVFACLKTFFGIDVLAHMRGMLH